MKNIFFLGTSRDVIRDEFPKDVRQEIGFSLNTAQLGGRAINAVPLVGFGGANVLEVVSNAEQGTFRAVYTVRFKDAIYVLHAFQKKSKRGIATPKKEMAVVKQRLRVAREHYERVHEKQKAEKRNARTKG